ncbi:unnamed protein product [Lepeophtheirus salmonis]|uniref:(salmon louse) hypothetical protein n=1 Tax=Lepeophtheirus salmonis TaxID=72036 RepID=A0A7R8CZ59_LEPSM|nr:unnamed protein product [Lepeophtheirus salmonis]CAF2973695.1 unnamed protein product [Lepeophtheirus salmonis]
MYNNRKFKDIFPTFVRGRYFITNSVDKRHGKGRDDRRQLRSRRLKMMLSPQFGQSNLSLSSPPPRPTRASTCSTDIGGRKENQGKVSRKIQLDDYLYIKDVMADVEENKVEILPIDWESSDLQKMSSIGESNACNSNRNPIFTCLYVHSLFNFIPNVQKRKDSLLNTSNKRASFVITFLEKMLDSCDTVTNLA